MTHNYILGRDDILVPAAAVALPHVQTPDMFGPCASLGISEGEGREARILAIVIYHQMLEAYRSCMISMVAYDPHWCTRVNIKQIFRIPFYQYGCNRVWTATPHTSERVIKFNKALGFKQEGVAREGFGPGLHMVVCGILRREYERRYEREQGKSVTASAA